MRPCTPASLCLAAVAVALPAAVPAYAQVPPPACASAEDHTFPLTSRIHGGPASYTAGGGFGTWYLELTNTTGRPCTGVHPVVVLVDEQQALEPSQPVLEFYDGAGRPHPVRLEATDRDELVGAFAADEGTGFTGFTVGPGRTLAVKVRLAVTSDAVPNEVTANVAVVQRHEDDGDWIGQSNDYRFRIDAGPGPGRGTGKPQTGKPEGEEPRTAVPETGGPARSEPEEPEEGKEEEDTTGTHDPGPGTPAPADSGTAALDPGSGTAAPDPLTDRLPLADELAPTGVGGRALALAVTAVVAGTLALALARRRR